MNAAALALVETIPESASTIAEKNPGQVILDQKLSASFFLELSTAIEEAPADMDERKNREARRSLAAQICRYKAPIDTARKRMKKEIDEKAGAYLVKLETLQADARKPLDAWEAEEKLWTEYATIKPEWPSSLILGRLETAKEEACRPSLKAAKEVAISALSAAYLRVKEAEENAEAARELAAIKAQKEEDERKAKAIEDELAEEITVKATAKPAQPSSFSEVRERVLATPQPLTANVEAVATSKPAPALSDVDRAKLTQIKKAIIGAAAHRSGFELPDDAAQMITRFLAMGKIPFTTVNLNPAKGAL